MLNKKLASTFSIVTIGAVYFLILVGGIVRSMEAGMGCPDWPKCFGSYVPPSSVAELPDDYEEYYVESRLEKNARLSNTLSTLGFEELSKRVADDPGIQEVTIFDPEKAWVEYINRVIGVLIGFLIILNMGFAFTYRKLNKWIPVLGVLAFLLVVFQGWVGSLVVSTNLLPGFISFHMALALLLVAILLLQQYLMRGNNEKGLVAKHWISALLILFTLQILFGTQVREQIDLLKVNGTARTNWISELGLLFYIHRSYSLLLAGIAGWVIYQNFKRGNKSWLLSALLVLMVLEILLGAVMAYFAVPAFAQPSHLFLGTVAFGLIFYLFLLSNFKRPTA